MSGEYMENWERGKYFFECLLEKIYVKKINKEGDIVFLDYVHVHWRKKEEGGLGVWLNLNPGDRCPMCDNALDIILHRINLQDFVKLPYVKQTPWKQNRGVGVAGEIQINISKAMQLYGISYRGFFKKKEKAEALS